jgi:hypothetical protein
VGLLSRGCHLKRRKAPMCIYCQILAQNHSEQIVDISPSCSGGTITPDLIVPELHKGNFRQLARPSDGNYVVE